MTLWQHFESWWNYYEEICLESFGRYVYCYGVNLFAWNCFSNGAIINYAKLIFICWFNFFWLALQLKKIKLLVSIGHIYMKVSSHSVETSMIPGHYFFQNAHLSITLCKATWNNTKKKTTHVSIWKKNHLRKNSDT